MFVYFIQRKGFLDGDRDYLRNRLNRCQKEQGKDKFYTFYRYFLLRLFHEGFGNAARNARRISKNSSAASRISTAACLTSMNIEKPNAMAKTSRFPTRPSSASSITSTNTSGIWTSARCATTTKSIPTCSATSSRNTSTRNKWGRITRRRTSPNTSARTPSCRSCSTPPAPSARSPLKIPTARPSGICCAKIPTATSTHARQKGRGQFRCRKKSHAGHQRRVQARRLEQTRARRICPAHRNLARSRRPAPALRGSPKANSPLAKCASINDFITLNLDIRQFAQDVIQNCEGPDLLMAFWQAITTITVLDPTGGSGAFLFAALNILEPLYEACLDRMEAFVAELERDWRKSTGPKNHKKFTASPRPRGRAPQPALLHPQIHHPQ